MIVSIGRKMGHWDYDLSAPCLRCYNPTLLTCGIQWNSNRLKSKWFDPSWSAVRALGESQNLPFVRKSHPKNADLHRGRCEKLRIAAPGLTSPPIPMVAPVTRWPGGMVTSLNRKSIRLSLGSLRSTPKQSRDQGLPSVAESDSRGLPGWYEMGYHSRIAGGARAAVAAAPVGALTMVRTGRNKGSVLRQE